MFLIQSIIYLIFVIYSVGSFAQNIDPATTPIAWDEVITGTEGIGRCEKCSFDEMIHTGHDVALASAAKLLSETLTQPNPPPSSQFAIISIINATDNLIYTIAYQLSAEGGVFGAVPHPGTTPLFENLNVAYPRTIVGGQFAPITFDFTQAICTLFPELQTDQFCASYVPVTNLGVNFSTQPIPDAIPLVAILEREGVDTFSGQCVCSMGNGISGERFLTCGAP